MQYRQCDVEDKISGCVVIASPKPPPQDFGAQRRDRLIVWLEYPILRGWWRMDGGRTKPAYWHINQEVTRAYYDYMKILREITGCI
jgi:hypothetical protein